MNTDFHKITFPVIGLIKNATTKKYDIKDVYGTAFYISNGFYITAGHVIKNATQCEKWGMGLTVEKRYKINFGVDFEIFDQFDVAIFRLEYLIQNMQRCYWDLSYPNLLTDIITSGYPYGLNPIKRAILGRAFKGYISSVKKSWITEQEVLELSFACPRGLSGAPIISEDNKKIIGLVLGNEQTEMEVMREKEIISEKEKNIYIKSEIYNYGIALCSNQIGSIDSKLLNCTISEFLISNKLLAEINNH